VTKLAKFIAHGESTAAAVVKRFDEIERLGQQQLEVTLIDPDPTQPRRDFDPIEMAALEQSISSQGVIQPILVERLGERFRIIAGERRWRASKKLRLPTIPAVVREALNDTDRLDIQLVENLIRNDLNKLERIEGIIRLIELRCQKTREIVIEELRKRYSDTSVRSDISPVVDSVLQQFNIAITTAYRQYQKVEKMDSAILKAIRSNQVSFTVGAIVDAIKDSVQKQIVLEACISKKLSKQEVELMIKNLKVKAKTKKPTEDWGKRLTNLKKIATRATPEIQVWLSAKLEELEQEFNNKAGLR
jgi:ParB family chromosome partitioning protein